MEDIYENEKLLKQIMDLLEQHFGYNCEVVLHDLTKDYDHTIVDIRNGHITGRRIGDCGSNLGLEVLRGTNLGGDRFNYVTHTKDAKILRSSSIYFRNSENKVVGSICVNTDITESVRYEAYLHAMNSYSTISDGSPEIFATDVKQLLEHFLQEGQNLIGKTPESMNKEDQYRFLQYLDKHGVFLITKACDRVCEFLGISRYKIYALLEKIRNEKTDEDKREQE